MRVQTKWRDIGLGLGLKKPQLDTIQETHRGSVNAVQDCMTDVFSRWDDGQTSEHSWKKLAEVLSSQLVGLPGLLPELHAILTAE